MRNAQSLYRTAALLALALVPALAQAQAREALGRSTATLTQAIRVGNMVYASGALPAGGANADTTIQGQTRSALASIKSTLELAGTTMEHAVKRLTSEVADFWGIKTRGRVKKGMTGDFAIFDPKTVSSPRYATPRPDLPGGGNRLISEPTGMMYTVVSGTVVCEGKKDTGLRPGSVLRSGNC